MNSQFTTPIITKIQIIPITNHNNILINLNNTHTPFFTHNIIIIKNNSNHTNIKKIPNNKKIHKTLKNTIPLIINKTLNKYKNILTLIHNTFTNHNTNKHNLQTFNLHTTIHIITKIKTTILNLLKQHLKINITSLLNNNQQHNKIKILNYLFFINNHKTTPLPYQNQPNNSYN